MFIDSGGEKLIADNFDNYLRPGKKDRFKQQIEFILEVDKLKQVLRQTILMDKSRQENSAEHSWHIALTVMVLSEYARDAGMIIPAAGSSTGAAMTLTAHTILLREQGKRTVSGYSPT